MARVEVAAGILIDDGHILLAQRASHQHQGGKWEFPGGKIEEGEEPRQALCRELQEELGVEVNAHDCQLFQHIVYDYPDKQVSLLFYKVLRFSGAPKGVEGQPLSWVNARQCQDYTLPKANKPVLEALLENWPNSKSLSSV